MEHWEWLELEHHLSTVPHITVELPSTRAERGVLTRAEEAYLRDVLAAALECVVFGLHRETPSWTAIENVVEQRAKRTSIRLAGTDPVSGRDAFWKAPAFERGSVVVSLSVGSLQERRPFACARGWGTDVNPGSAHTRSAWDMFEGLEISEDRVHGIFPASNGIEWITLRGTAAALLAVIRQFNK